MKRTTLAVEIGSARLGLVETLSSIPDESWGAPSLCAEWSVRDVIGHLLHQYEIYRAPYPRLSLVRAGLRINRFLSVEARRIASGLSNEELLRDLGRAVYEETRFWKLTPWPEFALTEFVIHGQDIRRPLGMPAEIPLSRLTLAADVFAGRGRPSPLRRVFQPSLPATRFDATDCDWSYGDGPSAQGPLEAIVLVLAGRGRALDDLAGDGVEPLRRALS